MGYLQQKFNADFLMIAITLAHLLDDLGIVKKRAKKKGYREYVIC